MAKPSCIIEEANSFDDRRRLYLFSIIDYRRLRMDGSGAKRDRNRSGFPLSFYYLLRGI